MAVFTYKSFFTKKAKESTPAASYTLSTIFHILDDGVWEGGDIGGVRSEGFSRDGFSDFKLSGSKTRLSLKSNDGQDKIDLKGKFKLNNSGAFVGKIKSIKYLGVYSDGAAKCTMSLKGIDFHTNDLATLGELRPSNWREQLQEKIFKGDDTFVFTGKSNKYGTEHLYDNFDPIVLGDGNDRITITGPLNLVSESFIEGISTGNGQDEIILKSTKAGQPEITLLDFNSSDTLDLRKVEISDDSITCNNKDFTHPGINPDHQPDWEIYGGESEASMVTSYSGSSCDDQLNIIV